MKTSTDDGSNITFSTKPSNSKSRIQNNQCAKCSYQTGHIPLRVLQNFKCSQSKCNNPNSEDCYKPGRVAFSVLEWFKCSPSHPECTCCDQPKPKPKPKLKPKPVTEPKTLTPTPLVIYIPLRSPSPPILPANSISYSPIESSISPFSPSESPSLRTRTPSLSPPKSPSPSPLEIPSPSAPTLPSPSPPKSLSLSPSKTPTPSPPKYPSPSPPKTATPSPPKRPSPIPPKRPSPSLPKSRSLSPTKSLTLSSPKTPYLGPLLPSSICQCQCQRQCIFQKGRVPLHVLQNSKCSRPYFDKSCGKDCYIPGKVALSALERFRCNSSTHPTCFSKHNHLQPEPILLSSPRSWSATKQQQDQESRRRGSTSPSRLRSGLPVFDSYYSLTKSYQTSEIMYENDLGSYVNSQPNVSHINTPPVQGRSKSGKTNSVSPSSYNYSERPTNTMINIQSPTLRGSNSLIASQRPKSSINTLQSPSARANPSKYSSRIPSGSAKQSTNTYQSPSVRTNTLQNPSVRTQQSANTVQTRHLSQPYDSSLPLNNASLRVSSPSNILRNYKSQNSPSGNPPLHSNINSDIMLKLACIKDGAGTSPDQPTPEPEPSFCYTYPTNVSQGCSYAEAVRSRSSSANNQLNISNTLKQKVTQVQQGCHGCSEERLFNEASCKVVNNSPFVKSFKTNDNIPCALMNKLKYLQSMAQVKKKEQQANVHMLGLLSKEITNSSPIPSTPVMPPKTSMQCIPCTPSGLPCCTPCCSPDKPSHCIQTSCKQCCLIFLATFAWIFIYIMLWSIEQDQHVQDSGNQVNGVQMEKGRDMSNSVHTYDCFKNMKLNDTCGYTMSLFSRSCEYHRNS